MYINEYFSVEQNGSIVYTNNQQFKNIVKNYTIKKNVSFDDTIKPLLINELKSLCLYGDFMFQSDRGQVVKFKI